VNNPQIENTNTRLIPTKLHKHGTIAFSTHVVKIGCIENKKQKRSIIINIQMNGAREGYM
jgi:hypothetical protein